MHSLQVGPATEVSWTELSNQYLSQTFHWMSYLKRSWDTNKLHICFFNIKTYYYYFTFWQTLLHFPTHDRYACSLIMKTVMNTKTQTIEKMAFNNGTNGKPCIRISPTQPFLITANVEKNKCSLTGSVVWLWFIKVKSWRVLSKAVKRGSLPSTARRHHQHRRILSS